MEIKKIKKILLGLSVVAFAVGCGSDKKTTTVENKITGGSGQIKVGDSLWTPVGLKIGAEKDAYRLSAISSTDFYYSDTDNAIGTVDKGEVNIDISVIGLTEGNTNSNNKVTIYAFTQLDTLGKTEGLKDNVNVARLEKETVENYGVTVKLTGNTDTAVTPSVYLGINEELTSRYDLTTTAETAGKLNNVRITIKKSAANQVLTAVGASVILRHRVTNTAKELEANEIGDVGTAEVELISTEKRTAPVGTSDADKIRVSADSVKGSKGAACSGASANSNADIAAAGLTDGAISSKYLAHFKGTAGTATCSINDVAGLAASFAVASDTTVKAVAHNTDATKNTNKYFGIKVEGGAQVVAVKITGATN